MPIQGAEHRSKRARGNAKRPAAGSVPTEKLTGPEAAEDETSDYQDLPDGQPKNKAKLISKLLQRVEQKLESSEVKPSLGDFIRLLQLQKEIEEEQPREIIVRWVGLSETDCVDKR